MTPYQTAAQAWDERIGSARVQARNWRLMAFGCLIMSAGLGATLVWQSTRGSIVPWVVEIDRLGAAQAVAPATETYEPTDSQIAWHLSRFIENVRQIPADPIVLRQNWLRAYDFTTDRGALALNDHARENDTFASVGEVQVAVEISSVIRASDDKLPRRLDRAALLEGPARPHRTLDRNPDRHGPAPPGNAERLKKNPLGIFVRAKRQINDTKDFATACVGRVPARHHRPLSLRPQQIIWSITRHSQPVVRDRILRSLLPTREDMRRSTAPMLRGTGIGSLVGPLPGAGLALAAFLAYAIEKRVSPRSRLFGTGVVEGVAAPEAANNAAAQTAFIPTYALGIPGTTTTAIILGAMMMHGISPGPQFMRENVDMFWAIVASFWIGNLFLVLLNVPFIGLWVRLLKIPYKLLFPAITCLVCIGVYTVQSSVFDIWLLVLFGLLGYVLRSLDFEVAPMLMGFVLGPMLEENFRRAMLLAQGDVGKLFSGPVNAGMLTLFALAIGWSTLNRLRGLRAAPTTRQEMETPNEQ